MTDSYGFLPQRIDSDAPVFVISVAAQLAEMHPQTLRGYDRVGLVVPKRARGRGRRHQPIAGIGHRRHAGVRDDHDAASGFEVIYERRDPGTLVAVEERHHRGGGVDSETPAQVAKPPGVFGGDHVGLGEGGEQRGRGVFGMADGCAGQHQHARGSHAATFSHRSGRLRCWEEA